MIDDPRSCRSDCSRCVVLLDKLDFPLVESPVLVGAICANATVVIVVTVAITASNDLRMCLFLVDQLRELRCSG
jgi:hypothetical protein